MYSCISSIDDKGIKQNLGLIVCLWSCQSDKKSECYGIYPISYVHIGTVSRQAIIDLFCKIVWACQNESKHVWKKENCDLVIDPSITFLPLSIVSPRFHILPFLCAKKSINWRKRKNIVYIFQSFLSVVCIYFFMSNRCSVLWRFCHLQFYWKIVTFFQTFWEKKSLFLFSFNLPFKCVHLFKSPLSKANWGQTTKDRKKAVHWFLPARTSTPRVISSCHRKSQTLP